MMTMKSDGFMLELKISRCPRCNIASPLIFGSAKSEYIRKDNNDVKSTLLQCNSCMKSVLVEYDGAIVHAVYPSIEEVDNSIPEKARGYLNEAILSMAIAPSGALMLTASSVDEMLKSKNYLSGSLYSRIRAAKNDNVITAEMEAWAHEVRLDANDQRHADEEAKLATTDDARKAVNFAKALAEFLFVLPSKVKRGRLA